MHYKQALHKYEAKAANARRLAAVSMSAYLDRKITVRELSNSTLDLIDDWPSELRQADLNFDWRRIRDTYKREPKRLELSVWCDDRLCAVALCRMNENSVEVSFLEGDPRSDCPLKGHRVMVVLECAVNFAQGNGRTEIRLQPANDRLAELYVGVYGFTHEQPKSGSSYFKLEVPG